MTVTLEPARWPGGPLICPVVNLPAFASEAEMKRFKEENCPRCKTIREWQCEACGHWHSEGTAPSPSGDSSGTSRSSK